MIDLDLLGAALLAFGAGCVLGVLSDPGTVAWILRINRNRR